MSDKFTMMDDAPSLGGEPAQSMARDLVVSTHRGVLAGMDGAAREVAIDEYLKSYVEAEANGSLPEAEGDEPQGRPIKEEMLDVLRGACTPGVTQEKLATLLVGAPMEWLEHALETYGAEIPASKARKKLAAAVAKAMVANPQAVLDELSEAEGPHVRGVRRVAQAGGTLVVNEEELALGDLTSLPAPLAPYLFVFYHQGEQPGAGEFTFVIPTELRPMMAEADWDQVLQVNITREELYRYVTAAVWMRGMQDANELVREYAAACPEGLSVEKASDEVIFGIRQSTVDASVLSTSGDRFYLMAPEIGAFYANDHPKSCVYEEDSRFMEGELDETLKGLLGSHTERPVRPLPQEILEGDDVWTWHSHIPAALALRDFLDAHVPEGEDDYLFADEVLDDLTRMARVGMDPGDLRTRLETLFPTDDAQDMVRAYDLAAAFVLATPSWYLNGWSMLDLQQE